MQHRNLHSVWAMLLVSPEDQAKIHRFFLDCVGVPKRYLRADLHLSVYHARRIMPGVLNLEEAADIEILSESLRFMVMAPGGENPRPEIDPNLNAIGVRVKRDSSATVQIRSRRARFYPHESREVIGIRKPSNHVRSAFGARYFQPHITLLKSGSNVDADLTKMGVAFRSTIKSIHLDRFVVRCKSKLPTC